MEWIRQNRFLTALIAITVVGIAGMAYWGKAGATRYEQAKMNFDAALADGSRIEMVKPYPIEQNRAAKKKAIEDFRSELELLQQKYDAFRPGNLEVVSPEKFIDRLKEVNDETVAACKRNALVLPDSFFCGFKAYTGKLPPRAATGVLGYQLEAINEVLLVLANSGATELLNLHRPLLEEETGKRFRALDQAVARPLPLEFTFRGPEKSLRNFVNTLSASDRNYWVIRSLRVGNEKKDPPRTSDAKFETRRAAADAAAPVFGNIFQFDDTPEEDAPAPETDGAEAPKDAPQAPAPAARSEEGERILSLVLGNEELIVHIRVDLMMFLPPKPLP